MYEKDSVITEQNSGGLLSPEDLERERAFAELIKSMDTLIDDNKNYLEANTVQDDPIKEKENADIEGYTKISSDPDIFSPTEKEENKTNLNLESEDDILQEGEEESEIPDESLSVDGKKIEIVEPITPSEIQDVDKVNKTKIIFGIIISALVIGICGLLFFI